MELLRREFGSTSEYDIKRGDEVRVRVGRERGGI